MRVAEATTRSAELEAEPRQAALATIGYTALLVVIAGLVPFRETWAVQLLLLVLLLTVPGMILLRAVRMPGASVAAFPAYVPAASLIVLTGAGLACNYIAPLFGVEVPLRTGPMLVSLEVVCAALLAATMNAGPSLSVPWRAVELRAWHLWPVLLPIATAAGAARLTFGHGSLTAALALGATVLTLVVCVALAERMTRTHLAVVLYGVGLAAIWSFTLRGQFVYGFDISSEFHVLASTFDAGVWETVHSDDAYGAMLSLTVLPAVLQSVAGLSDLALLKAVYPAIFALVPPAVFWIASRYVTRRYAVVAAAFIVVQLYFFQQLPAIARQEIALVFFVALVAAALDSTLPRRAQWPLVTGLALGLVVSHYSTTYLAGGVFAIAVVLQVAVNRVRPMPKLIGGTAVAVVALAVGGAVWYGAVTKSTENVSNFTTDVKSRGVDLLPNAKEGQSIVSSYLRGNQSTQVSAGEYAATVRETYRRERPYVAPLAAAAKDRYELRDAATAGTKKTSLGFRALDAGQLLVSQVANLLAILGALWLVLSRRTSARARQLGLIGLSTLLVLFFIRLSGTAANAYNQERAFVQLFVPLAIGIAWVLERAGQRFRIHAVLSVLAALALGVVFVSTSGLRGQLFGGASAVNLSESGEDYERFYVSEPELAAARWLNGIPRPPLVYADRYGQLRVLAATGRSKGLVLDITPRTLDHRAWVYASRTNTLANRTRGDARGRYAIFEWPGRYLSDYWNVVYSNGSSRVYNR